MKRTIFSIAILAILALNLSAAIVVKADFNGSWKLDAAKSTGLPPGMDQSMKVTHEGDAVKIETTVKGEQGEQTVPDSYTLDGKEKDLARGNAKGKRTSKWTTDGSGFEVAESVKAETPEGEVEIQTARKWTLSADGKTLTIEMNVKGPQGEQQSKRTFIKQ